MAIVYQHTRIDKNEVFYIGIGTSIKRSKSKTDRNSHWHNIVNKTEYTIEVLYDNLTEQEAKEKEKELIAFYGRHDLGKGPLVNMTDGGDGILNVSEESRKKIRLVHKGKKLSEAHIQKLKDRECKDETRKKLRDANLKNGNKPPAQWGHKYNSGRTQSEETRKKRSLALKGRTFSEATRKLKSEIAKSKGQRPYQPTGFKHSEETKKRLSEIKKGIKPNMNQDWCQNISKGKRGLKQPKVVCPHCRKEGGQAAMTRYHFNNCRVLSS